MKLKPSHSLYSHNPLLKPSHVVKGHHTVVSLSLPCHRHNTYNQDYGLDVYEDDFINDFIVGDELATCTTPKSQKRAAKRSLATQMETSSDSMESSSVSSSDSDVGNLTTRNVPKRLVLSSDDEAVSRVKPGGGVVMGGVKRKGDSDEDEVRVMRKRTRRRRSGFTARFSSSSEEGVGEGETVGDTVRIKKSRKVKKWESDEEIG
jgi:hypothetical protein